MALVTITHQWEAPDGSTPNGQVRFSLSAQSEGAQGVTVDAAPVIATLIDGALSQSLMPNLDEDGNPDGGFYWVEEQVVGSTPASYPLTLPAGGPYDLWTLREQS